MGDGRAFFAVDIDAGVADVAVLDRDRLQEGIDPVILADQVVSQACLSWGGFAVSYPGGFQAGLDPASVKQGIEQVAVL